MTTNFWILLSYIVRCVHWVVISANTLALFIVPFTLPWYLWIPLWTLLLSPVLGEDRCILNQLENKCRIKGGLEPIIFIGITRL